MPGAGPRARLASQEGLVRHSEGDAAARVGGAAGPRRRRVRGCGRAAHGQAGQQPLNSMGLWALKGGGGARLAGYLRAVGRLLGPQLLHEKLLLLLLLPLKMLLVRHLLRRQLRRLARRRVASGRLLPTQLVLLLLLPLLCLRRLPLETLLLRLVLLHEALHPALQLRVVGLPRMLVQLEQDLGRQLRGHGRLAARSLLY